MVSTVSRRRGGTEKTGLRGQREKVKEAEGEKKGKEAEAEGVATTKFSYEGDPAEDELAVLMPGLKRQLQSFEQEDEGSANIMGGVNYSGHEKENDVSDQNTFRQPKRRLNGTGRRFTTTGHIPLDQLYKNVTSASSPSLYQNISTVLKENVNRDVRQSDIVKDFWATENERRLYAVARRRMSGIKTPVQAKPRADRQTRQQELLRRRSRKLSQEPIKLDLYLDAAKISGWDEEPLAVEEEKPRRPSATNFSAGTALFEANFLGLNQGRKESVQASAIGVPEMQIQADEEDSLRHGSKPDNPSQSPDSLPDMDLSAGESELGDYPVEGKHGENPLQIPGDPSPDPLMQVNLDGGKSPVVDCSEKHNPEEITKQDPRPMDFNLKEAQPFTPYGDPLITDRRLQLYNGRVTSPTPPSKPVDMSRILLDRDVHQRRLAFLSSPSSQSNSTEGDIYCPATEELVMSTKKFAKELESSRLVPNFEADQLSTSKSDFEGAKLNFGEPESRDDLDHARAYRHDVEASSGVRLQFGEGDLLKDMCNRRDQQMSASKVDHQVEGQDYLDQLSPASLVARARNALSSAHANDAVVDFSRSTPLQLRTRKVGKVLKEVKRIERQRNPSPEGNFNEDDEKSLEVKGTITADEAKVPTEMEGIQDTQSEAALGTPGVAIDDAQLRYSASTAAAEELARPMIMWPKRSSEGPSAHMTVLSDGGAPDEEDGGRETPNRQESPSLAPCGRVTLHTNDEARTQKVAAAERDQVDSPEKSIVEAERNDFDFAEKFLDSFVPYDGGINSGKHQTFNIKACIENEEENALQLLSLDYLEDDDDDPGIPDEFIETPDIVEAETLHYDCKDTSLTEEPEQISSEDNHEGAAEFWDDAVADSQPQIASQNLPETGDREDPKPCADAPKKDAPAEGMTEGAAVISTQPKRRRLKKKSAKSENRRFSLAGSGSLWKEGQRRSQRIRPPRRLEWWRGEKMVYGRIHNSLNTVIGIKLSSPGKYARGIKAPFIVESYVSDEYNDLLRFCAL